MPIPTDGAWPPPAHAPAYRSYRDWDAWYTGDPDRLYDAYFGRTSTGKTLPPSQRVRSVQYAGGVIGTLSRWLWGTPPSTTSRDGRLHVPLPADLAATSANLLFSEPPQITHEDPGVMARLEQLDEDGLPALLLAAAEAASVLGDVYLRPVIDLDVFPDRAFPAVVHADGAIPTIRHGRLIDVTLWSELERDGQKVVRFLEHHDVVDGRGRIVYAVHVGTDDQLGDRGRLSDFTGAADFADLDGGVQFTGLDRLDVVRIANAGPQRQWRTRAALKYHGRSDFDGNEPLFDRLDEVWTSWMRDLRLARGRIIVPEYMLTSQGAGMGAYFDAEREVFTTLNAMPGQPGGVGITANQFDIRHEEHKATSDAVVELVLRHAGLSSQTLGEEGEVAVTATEVQARERQSFTTRSNRITGAWRPGLTQYVELHLAVERAAFGGSRPDPVTPSVEFGDSVSEAPETVARTLQLLAAAEAVSVDTKVRMLHPDWDDTQVREEVDRIRGDQPAPIEVGGALGALAGNQPADQGDGTPAGE